MGKRRRCTQGDRRQEVRMVRRWIGAMRERKERPEADGKWLRMSKREWCCQQKEKAQVTTAEKIFVDHALSLEPNDLDMLYLRGRWYRMVSQITWIQSTKSSLMSIPPPEGTLDQAIDDFKKAYLIAPFCQKTTVCLAINSFLPKMHICPIDELEIPQEKDDILYEVDELLSTFRVKDTYEAFEKLQFMYEDGDESIEVLFRLAKFCYNNADQLGTDKDKIQMLEMGKEYLVKVYETDKENFLAAKWLAYLSLKLLAVLPFRSKMYEARKTKAYLDRAIALHPMAWYLQHLRGRWYHEFANLSWIKRKISVCLGCTAPEGTLEEAIDNYRSAQQLFGDSLRNHVFLGIALFEDGRKFAAKRYFHRALTFKTITETRIKLNRIAEYYFWRC
ncbi:hypothetical protein L3Y34_000419 [Caenorhabditis briggsae]|uniref:Uncharacterized protein n=1 Tax=Caenorhabditis briggsae TaxID=6238 RepID=A0AAE9D9A9_CAEBR|nr:hypothetical protein L3Y34_000419 [Caenorhabditis briggsae]